MRTPASTGLGLVVVVLGALGCGGCGKAASSGVGQQTPGQPVETRAANGDGQRSAFPEQTRAPYLTTETKFETRKVATNLEHPWSLAFLPDGAMLVTERPGRIRIVAADGALSPAIEGLPKIFAQGQGGLFDVVPSPGFASDGRVYIAYAEPRDNGNGTAVAHARLVREGAPRLENVQIIWRMTPTFESEHHFGGRIVFASDGTLFITTGERSALAGRRQAQDVGSAFGKMIRVRPDGGVPEDNPFAARAGALREIYSIGHRNMQAAALNPETGALWVVDHGARGGDEINVVRPGRDYGWPTISYGVEYAGDKIGDGITAKEGMEQPIYYWDPSIAPSGMAFYSGNLFPNWRGSLFVGALAGKHLVRLTLKGERVVGEERLLADYARIRDVRVGPDGAVYVLTDDEKGELLKLVPGSAP